MKSFLLSGGRGAHHLAWKTKSCHPCRKKPRLKYGGHTHQGKVGGFIWALFGNLMLGRRGNQNGNQSWGGYCSCSKNFRRDVEKCPTLNFDNLNQGVIGWDMVWLVSCLYQGKVNHHPKRDRSIKNRKREESGSLLQ